MSSVKKILLDCDILRYRCGFAADSQIKKEAKAAEPGASDDHIKEMMAELDYEAIALHNVKTVVQAMQERYEGADLHCFIDGPGNFREQLATILPYKGNRDQTHKPKYYREIKDYLMNVWGAEEIKGIEADDAMGIAQCSQEDTIIISTDKDMLTVPGLNYNWVKDEEQYVTETDADSMFWWQMVVGDTTDNIPGIAGKGPVAANKLVAESQGDMGKLRESVQSLYRGQYGDTWARAYEECGRLLYILRHPDHLTKGCPLL